MRRAGILGTGIVAIAAVFLAGCTFIRIDEHTRWGCGPFRYEINSERATEDHVEAVHRAVASYASIIHREPEFVGFTDDRRSSGQRPPDAPVLIEWYWDHEAEHESMGFAEAFAVGDRYVGGSVYLRPSDAPMPSWLVERLTMHELGHIGGLDDVDALDEIMNPALTTADWGDGDLVGLILTHESCG